MRVVVDVDDLTESGRATFSSSRARSVAAARAVRGKRDESILGAFASPVENESGPPPTRSDIF